jgi:hypothetical protein
VIRVRWIHALASSLTASTLAAPVLAAVQDPGMAGLSRAKIKLYAFTTVLVLTIVFLAISAVIGRIKGSRRPPPGGPGRPPEGGSS